MKKKSFSSEVKTELCSVKFKESEAKAEYSAMLLFGENADNGSVTLKTDRAEIAARIQALIKKAVREEVPIDILKGRRNFSITVDLKLAEKIGVYFYEDGDIALDEDVYAGESEKRAFLRGAFIISGTMTDPLKEYNCELLTYNENMSFLSAELLESFGINANTVKRNHYYVTYLKDINSVSDFLNITGAHRMMMEFMVARIEKDLKNRSTRAGNCMAANLDKTIAASAKQCEAITKLQNSSLWYELDDETKELAQLRIEMFDSSLAAIGNKMTPPMTKSSVNRRMKKLIELAEEL
jgi:DNA-binding protein WhiA